MEIYKKPIISFLVIAAIAIAAYSPSLQGDFIWDDHALILSDAQIRSFRNIGAVFARDFFARGQDDFKYGYYRPVITLSYMADKALFGENATGFRVMNLLWHLLCVLLFYGLLIKIFPSHGLLNASLALVFAVHPTHAENVAWISGRTDLICVAFALTSAHPWLIYLGKNTALFSPPATKKISRKKPVEATQKKGFVFLAFSYASFMICLLSKETGIVIPFFMMALAWIFLPDARGKKIRKLWPELAGYFFVVALDIGLRAWVGRVPFYGSSSHHSVFKAAATFPSAFALYLQKLIAPVHSAAYIVWPYANHPFTKCGALGLMILILAVIFIVSKRKTMPAATAAVFIFLVGFGPLANLIPIGGPSDMGFVVAERFLYLPSLFAALIVATLFSDHENSGPKPGGIKAMSMALCALSLFYGIQTARASMIWRNEASVYENALKRYPDAPMLWTNLGAYYRERGDIDMALDALRKAESINDRLHSADPVAIYNNMGTALASDGKPDEALVYFNRAVKSGGRTDQAYFNKAEALRLLGRGKEALDAYDRGIEKNGEEINPHIRRGQLRLAFGQYDGAIKDLKFVLDKDKENAQAMAALGLSYRSKGDNGRALPMLRKAVAHGAEDFDVLMALGGAEGQAGRFAEALRAFERAQKQRPDSVEAVTASSAALFRLGNKEKAGDLLSEALAKHPENIDILIHLMHWRYEMKNKGELEKLLQRAERVDPDNPVVKKYRSILK